MNQGRDGDPPLTSDDLFGDLVDPKVGARESAPAKKPSPPRVHTGPIKLKIAEPGRPTAPAKPQELSALVDAFADPVSAGKPGPRPASPPPNGETPTPVAVEPLPDLPELGESQREAEALSELKALTQGLRRSNEKTEPGEGHLDLASVAEHAIEDATPHGDSEPDAVLPPPPSEAGLAYGPYRLTEKIATGGMAEVFKATRSGAAGFEKVVAVKRILPHLSTNREFLDMFVDEAKMVAGLQHPNIVQIFDLGCIGTSYYIAMEYVHGADLRSIMRRLKERDLKMPADIAMYVVSKVAAGLDYAHKKKNVDGRPMKIVHRDVSPQNILISYDGEVKLTDFGIAKAATKASTTEKGALRGKLMYMSPEQAWGRNIDHRSDLFSLGIVLYELITDQRPFLGSSDMSLLDKVRRGTVAPPSSLNPEIPARLEKLVLKALEREAADRHRDAGAMHQELESLLQEPGHAVAAADAARFVRILFERSEREPVGAVPVTATEEGAPELEVDLGALDVPPNEPLRIEGDAMSVDRLLKRFGPG